MIRKYILLVACLSTYLNADDSFLVFGPNGWIGGKIIQMLTEDGYTVHKAESRMQNREDVIAEIEKYQPTYIINCAGVTGRPNVDWCETHKIETLRTNIIGTLTLVDVAYLYGIQVTNFSTGCIFEYDDAHPMYSGIGFKEGEKPNFDGSFYSETKGYLEEMLINYPNLLNLRLRMPISSDLSPRSLVTKLLGYEKVINIPNSMSILDDLLPAAIDMTIRKCKGCFNFVNPGTLSHNQLLDLYIEYVDPTYSYQNFTIEEQNRILLSKRSNNELDCSKLLKECPYIKTAEEALLEAFKKLAASM